MVVINIYTPEFPYSNKTQELANLFPIWTKIRHNKESEGQKFLNTPSLLLEELENYLNYVSDNIRIQTADINKIDRCFKSELPPKLNKQWSIKIYADNKLIPIAKTSSDFYKSEKEIAYIDWSEHSLFLRFNHESIKISGSNNKEILPITNLQVTPQHVWNEFDDFGLLFDTPRLPLETNADYKDRILYTFKYPANSSKLGLINALGRHLGLITKKKWENANDNFILPKKTIVETIRVNGKTHSLINKLEDGYELYFEEIPEGEIYVTYIDNIELYALYEFETDNNLFNLLYNNDFTAKNRLKNIAEYINQKAPMLWGYFKFNEHNWDSVDPENSGLFFIPSIYDANYESWKNYTPKQPRKITILNTNKIEPDAEIFVDNEIDFILTANSVDVFTSNESFDPTLIYKNCVGLGALYYDGIPLDRPTRPWRDTTTFNGQTGNIPAYHGDMNKYSFGPSTDESNLLYWHKFTESPNSPLNPNKTILIADRCLVSSISWDHINSAGFVTGKEIELEGKTYICRLLTGGNNNRIGKANSEAHYTGGKLPNEWDRYIMNNADSSFGPYFKDAPIPARADWNTTSSLYQNAAAHAREHNQAWNWISMMSWCQDHSSISFRTYRGNASARFWNSFTSSHARTDYGWRPVLELTS